eukprot:7642425-Lingulodinium_polyedra.AAC.1
MPLGIMPLGALEPAEPPPDGHSGPLAEEGLCLGNPCPDGELVSSRTLGHLRPVFADRWVQ